MTRNQEIADCTDNYERQWEKDRKEEEIAEIHQRRHEDFLRLTELYKEVEGLREELFSG